MQFRTLSINDCFDVNDIKKLTHKSFIAIFSKLAANGSTLKFEKPAPMYRKPRIAK